MQRDLKRDLAHVRGELAESLKQRQSADEEHKRIVKRLSTELRDCKQQLEQVWFSNFFHLFELNTVCLIE